MGEGFADCGPEYLLVHFRHLARGGDAAVAEGGEDVLHGSADAVW
jgi:hypothetical protein